MQWIKFEATDAWFFRDGRPFNAGEESWANSLFPPFPSVVYGVLRSVYFGENIGEFIKANEKDKEDEQENDPTLKLRIRQFLFDLSDRGAAFPMPADLLREKESGIVHTLRLEEKPKDKASFISNYKDSCTHLLLPPFPDKADDLFGKAALPATQFADYLAGKAVTDVVDFKNYLTSEPKVGVGRRYDTRHAEEGMLYKVRYRRPEGRVENFCYDPRKQIRLLVGAENLELPTDGLTKFGADGKLAVLSEGAYNQFGDLPSFAKGEVFKMYLATPGVFNEGWAPLALFDEYGLRLCTTAIGKPLPFGGFDMIARRPKPMRKAVPAGSVYFLQEKEEGGRAAEFIQKFHGKALKGKDSKDEAHVPDKLNRQGFGIAYFGKTKPNV